MLATTTVLELAGSTGSRGSGALSSSADSAGCGPGWFFGLQRHDVDLLHGTMTVVRSVPHEITGQGRIFTAPKSDAGYRTVALPLPGPHRPEGASVRRVRGDPARCSPLHQMIRTSVSPMKI